MHRKLGKLAKKEDHRTLKLMKYGLAALPQPPAACNLTRAISDLGELLNDQIGDCTVAGAGHLVQSWTAEAGKQVIPPDSAILAVYEAVGGYVPGDQSTDNGAACLDVLNYWRKTGIANHKIGAFAELSASNIEEIKRAVYYFGGVYTGFSLPDAFQAGALNSGWEYAGQTTSEWQPDPNNGHCVPIVAYDAEGFTIITWGSFLKVNWAFGQRFMDEAYACLSVDILNGTGESPGGLKLAALQDDLARVTSN